ncbi:MAG: alpha/beta hydrolase [Phycisphaerae bacterium]|nr:alpha/beta hydrolase [Phycisphaerae bacterium]
MFKFVNREQEQHLVLFDGWAFDHRIFSTLDLPYNYIFFCGEPAADFENRLKQALAENRIDKISLLGWSQGAFAACDFAAGNPDMIEEIVLVSARKKYEKEGLDDIKNYLVRNRTAYLYKFYKDCFSQREKKSYQWFKESCLRRYLEEMSLGQLINGLDRLGEAEITPHFLKKIKHIKIIHGKADSIAPFDEAVKLSNSLPQSQLITFAEAGHLPFLQKNFKRRLYEC